MTPLRKDKSTRANALGIHVQNCFQRANKLASFPAFLIPKTSQSHLSEPFISWPPPSEIFYSCEKPSPYSGDINLWRTLKPHSHRAHTLKAAGLSILDTGWDYIEFPSLKLRLGYKAFPVESPVVEVK